MSIRFECPNCGDVSILKDRMIGKMFRCPECDRETIVRTAPELDDEEELEEKGPSRPVRFLVAGGIVVLAVLGVCAVMAWRHYLDRQPVVEAKRVEPGKDTKAEEEVLLKRAAEAFQKADYDLAISCASEAIQLNPRNPQAYRQRAEAYRAKRQFEPALADYAEAIKCNPNDGLAYVGRASVYATTGDIPRAIENCQTAEKLGVNRAQASDRVAGIFRAQGSEHLKKCRAFRAGVDKEGEFIRQNLGFTTQDLMSIADEDGKKANEYYRAALRLNPRDLAAYEELTLLQLTFGVFDEAIKLANEGLKLQPKAALLYFYRGAALSQKGDGRADADFKQAVKLNPQLAAQRAGFYKR